MGHGPRPSELVNAQELNHAFSEFVAGVNIVCAEIPSGCQSARGATSNGICVGILAACPVPVIQVSPTETKLAAVGDKGASKQVMIGWAVGEYPDAPWLVHRGRLVASNEHLADAVAILHAGVRTPEFRSAMSILASLSS